MHWQALQWTFPPACRAPALLSNRQLSAPFGQVLATPCSRVCRHCRLPPPPAAAIAPPPPGGCSWICDSRVCSCAAAERLGVFAEPEVVTKQLTAAHPFLVIASDGVFEFLSSQSVIDMVRQGAQARQRGHMGRAKRAYVGRAKRAYVWSRRAGLGWGEEGGSGLPA